MSLKPLLFNIDKVYRRYPNNKIDILQNAIEENVLKTQKEINNKNNNKLNDSNNKKELIELKNSYKDSLILLNMMQQKLEKAIFKKYEIEKNHNEINKNLIMKKKFLKNPIPIFSKIK